MSLCRNWIGSLGRYAFSLLDILTFYKIDSERLKFCMQASISSLTFLHLANVGKLNKGVIVRQLSCPLCEHLIFGQEFWENQEAFHPSHTRL